MTADSTHATGAAASAVRAQLRTALPFLLAGGLFALGLYALYHLLASVHLADVAAQFRATPRTTLLLALLTTLCGYLALTGYDWSGLRYIGKSLPLPVVLTGGLLAYAFGNTIGLTAVSGGAVRWRLYSGLGLDGYDVAAVSTFSAVSSGLAVTILGLCALVVDPQALVAVLPMGNTALRLGAVAVIVAIVGPLVWASVRQKALKLGRFRLVAPTPGILGAQVLFGLADVGFAALTLYLLLPVGDIGFVPFLAVFAAAIMAGIVSHVPGGVGVFETVVIAAMPAGTPAEKVAAGLLLYRLAYYVVPFVLALAVLAAYEAWRALGGRVPANAAGRMLMSVEPAFRSVAPLVPIVLFATVFGAGLWMSFSALIPPVTQASDVTEALFPLAFVEGSALLSSALGASLILVSLGLLRRNQGAFWMACAAMAASVAVALLHGLDVERAATLALLLAALVPFRHEFHRATALSNATLSPGGLVLLAAVILSFGFILFFAHKSIPYANELWWQFAVDGHAPRALRAGLVASVVLGLGALTLLLRVRPYRPAPPDAESLALAAAIAGAADNPEAGFALTGDKALYFSADRRAFVMFAVSGRNWIAYGGPVGPAGSAAEAAQGFVDAARRAGARPVFYEVGAGQVPLMLDFGLSLFKMGEEAVVDLERFSLAGAARKKLRAAHARALRDGLSLDITAPPHDPALLAELRALSDSWLAAKKTREKGFSVGQFAPDWLNRWPIALIRHQGRIVAFANILQGGAAGMASIDLMRHSIEAPAGTMDFLFTELMLRLKAEGLRAFSLGMAPLSGLAPGRSRRNWDRLAALIYRNGGAFYNFEGLRAFKDKFDPDWLPHYLAAPSALPPLLTLAAAARLIAGPKPPHRTMAGKGVLNDCDNGAGR
ncbi:MAG: bifunctional lysylphosphatidylglycerol flippase/synthetase MprF [Rhodobacteraceae bacterium]|nr:bifunctional lysylphosphatidylglycerol flippase/synthetase MprF [Paracoccaceae bacterium]